MALCSLLQAGVVQLLLQGNEFVESEETSEALISACANGCQGQKRCIAPLKEFSPWLTVSLYSLTALASKSEAPGSGPVAAGVRSAPLRVRVGWHNGPHEGLQPAVLRVPDGWSSEIVRTTLGGLVQIPQFFSRLGFAACRLPSLARRAWEATEKLLPS